MRPTLIRFLKLLTCSSITLGFQFAGSAHAETAVTDVTEVVNARIRESGAYPVRKTWTTVERTTECLTSERWFMQRGEPPGGGDHCHRTERRVQHSRIDQENLTASDIRIEANELPVFGAVKYESFPQDALSTAQENLNCSSVTGSANVSLQLQATRSYSLTLSKTITHIRSRSIGVGASFFGVVQVKGDLGFSDQNTTTRATAEGVSNTYVITGTGSVQMPPKSRTISLLSSYRVRQSVPFSMNVLVDGELSSNDAGKTKISDILDEAARRFEVKGSLSSDDASAGTLTLKDAPFTDNLCASNNMTISKGSALDGVVLQESRLQLRGAKISTDQ